MVILMYMYLLRPSCEWICEIAGMKLTAWEHPKGGSDERETLKKHLICHVIETQFLPSFHQQQIFMNFPSLSLPRSPIIPNLPKLDKALVQQQRHEISGQVVAFARQQQDPIKSFRPELNVNLEGRGGDWKMANVARTGY